MSSRKMTPKGQMTRGNNSGPAVMLMPPHIRATFMPPPPLKCIPPLKHRRKGPMTGVFRYLDIFEKSPAAEPRQATPKNIKELRAKERKLRCETELQPKIEKYRQEQKDSEGKCQGMNCYNTLFVGRLAHEVTERKLLREFEAYGPVRDLKLVFDAAGKSKGYGFVEYENEEDMKRAYRAADRMKIEGREIVVDVERGHTVPTWLPRRLGGGLGGTRLGGKDQNIKAPGRFDPNRAAIRQGMGSQENMPGIPGRDQGAYDNRGAMYGNYPSYGGGGYGAPRREWSGDRPAHDTNRRRRRSRSRSPERRYAPRPRY